MPLPKRPVDGEAGRFRSIGPNGTNYDPTQPRDEGQYNDGVFPGLAPKKDTNRWGQFDRGRTDSQGGEHDW